MRTGPGDNDTQRCAFRHQGLEPFAFLRHFRHQRLRFQGLVQELDIYVDTHKERSGLVCFVIIVKTLIGRVESKSGYGVFGFDFRKLLLEW